MNLRMYIFKNDRAICKEKKKEKQYLFEKMKSWNLQWHLKKNLFWTFFFLKSKRRKPAKISTKDPATFPLCHTLEVPLQKMIYMEKNLKV